MAIRIPILTSFDPKGLKQANAQFAQLQTSIGSLGRNFAIAGTAIVAGTALLGKAVQSASNFEAQFEGVNQVFGKAAKSVQDFADQAAQSAGLSATEALTAAKTFGLFAKDAGLGAQGAADFSTTMVQLAGDLGSFNELPTADALAAIQSGLMGQAEPLRKFGVFLDEDRLKLALFKATGEEVTGSLSAQQKMMASYYAILQQTTIQQGDFVKYQDTLGNQLKTISKEFENLTKDIGMMLIPAITDAMPQIKEMARTLGEELKAAIGSIDWKALTKTVVDLTRFFAENAGTIIQVVTAIFALNTAYKLMQVAIGITNVALALNKWWLAQVATGTGIATVATTIFSTALKLIPIVAIIAGLALLYAAFTNTEKWAGKSASGVANFGDKLDYAGGKAAVLRTKLEEIPKQVTTTYTLIRQTAGQVASSFGGSSFDAKQSQFEMDQLIPKPQDKGGAAPKASASPLQQLLADSQKTAAVLKKETALEKAGLTKEVAQWVTSSNKPIVAAREAQAKIAKNGAKAVANLTKAYSKSTAGQQASAQAAQAAAESASNAAAEFAASQAAAAAAEAAAVAERQRIYQSFADSVKNTFAGIKNSIMGAFDLTQLGGSTNSITRNMDKLLTRLRAFATNVKSLATMGLSPALLQQIISAGPMAGARLAEGLVMGGAGGLSAINAGYSEFGALSSQIAQTGTESLFNRDAQQTVYNINVDGGVGSGSTIGKAIVDAIKAYERTSGAVWQGA